MLLAAADGSLIAALFRVVLVFALLWAVLRVIGRVTGRAPKRRLVRSGRGQRHDRVVEILDRQSIGRESSVAVVRVGDRRLALGITEHGINVLAELEPEPGPEAAAAAVATDVVDLDARRTGTPDASGGPIGVRLGRAVAGGSSPSHGLRAVVDELRERTVRRSATSA